MTDFSDKKNILIVDDIPAFCRQLRQMLNRETHAARVCTDPAKVPAMLEKRPYHLVITTLVMKKMAGFDLIRKIRGSGHSVPIMLITGHGSRESAIEAQRLGVSDYLYKPVAPRELIARVEKVLGQNGSEVERMASFKLDKLVSNDPAMKSIFDMVEAIAISNSRVLILGETGTGKQLIAQAIHSLSPRKNEPFIEINCAAIPGNLLESEFFGHERGSFTGAVDQRIGRFEEAGGGTIFLDEIGEIDYALQAKLLRVLEDGVFSRVGGSRMLRSRARVIAATNRDLRVASQKGDFRADLFYRLHVISLRLPPLRDRLADLPLLTRYFQDKYLPPGHHLEFSQGAFKVMRDYGWPGNVRELEHLVERLCVMHPGKLVREEELPDYFRQPGSLSGQSAPEHLSFREAVNDFEKRYLEKALDLHHGNMAAAARHARMDRAQFFRLARRHGLDTKRPRRAAG